MSPFWFQQLLTNFSCGLDAVVFFLYYCWCCCCWLGTVSLSIILCVLQPKTPRERLCFLGFSLQCLVGDLFSIFLGGPTTDHPCSLPASPDASDASDVIRYRPSQMRQDHRRTRNHYLCLAQFLGSKVSRLLSSTMELPLVPFRVVPGPH